MDDELFEFVEADWLDPIKSKSMRARRIHHAQRIIARRWKIIKKIWCSGFSPKPGRLRKWNLSCNCYLCKWNKKMKLRTIKEIVYDDKIKQISIEGDILMEV